MGRIEKTMQGIAAKNPPGIKQRGSNERISESNYITRAPWQVHNFLLEPQAIKKVSFKSISLNELR